MNEKWKKIFKILCYKNGRDVCIVWREQCHRTQRPTGWWQEGRIRSYSLQLVREEMIWDSSPNSNMTTCKCISGSSEKRPAVPCGLLEYNDKVGRWMGKCLAITCLTVMIQMWLEGWPQQTDREVMIYFWCPLSQFFFEEIFHLLILFWNYCDKKEPLFSREIKCSCFLELHW